MFGNMLKLFLSSLFLVICLIIATCSGSKVLRVFQGRDAVPGEFPYVVALAVKFNEGSQFEFFESFCSGSIITPVWTLSAGHCVEMVINISFDILHREIGNPKLVIRYTIFSPNKHPEWGVSDILITRLHPGYKIKNSANHFSLINDIGLVKTNNATGSVFGRCSPVDYRTLYGHKVSSVGYGLMNSEDGVDDALSLNRSLQVYGAIVAKCQHAKDIVRPSFCLSWECSKPATSCNGDSGAPIIHPTGIIAVVTSGDNENCNTIEKLTSAGTVTPISPFVDWIIRQIRK